MAVKRGTVQTNPFADLPVSKAIGKRERVLGDDDSGGLVGGRRRWSPLRHYCPAADPATVAGMIRRTCRPGPCQASRTKNGLPHVVPLSAPARGSAWRIARGGRGRDQARDGGTSRERCISASRTFGHPFRRLVQGEDRARRGHCGRPYQGCGSRDKPHTDRALEHSRSAQDGCDPAYNAWASGSKSPRRS